MKILTISQGSSEQALESDIILRSGEFFKETDTNKVKIGDGSTPYRGLKYIIPIDLKVDGTGRKYLNDQGQYVELDLKTIDDKIENLRTELIKALEEDEFVISQAINLLNHKHNDLTSVVDNNKSELDQRIDELESDYNGFKDSINQSINTQGQSIENLFESLTETNRSLDEKTRSLENTIIENEEVVATAINLLHNKLTITEI